MKVLIIDNTQDRDCWGSADLKRFVTNSPDRTAFVRRAPQSDLPDSVHEYDRIILSGSRSSCLSDDPWVAKLDHLIREALTENRPILGVCYGHQAIARVLGGKNVLRKGHAGEFGWTEIEIVAPSPLFKGLPERFWSFSSHYEEVSEIPPGMKLLAQSKACAIQATQLEGRPVYGIQFHPEKDLGDTKKSLREWSLEKRKNVLRENDSPKLYNADVGTKIFGNFLEEL
jgi:GMP synthase (glutamine-hydrolysing)